MNIHNNTGQEASASSLPPHAVLRVLETGVLRSALVAYLTVVHWCQFGMVCGSSLTVVCGYHRRQGAATLRHHRACMYVTSLSVSFRNEHKQLLPWDIIAFPRHTRKKASSPVAPSLLQNATNCKLISLVRVAESVENEGITDIQRISNGETLDAK
ncbi:hypothetical protein EVAR_10531_1 [Eumeta japonica]|uniref:Uncharacterized protein n=1 Tax=Eumeta variegata TaxID=151549 RepID=A0A4C1TIM8_EUMVA|nr:hypothetical protein EVAR_10531_1 [Eumeta japonica]